MNRTRHNTRAILTKFGNIFKSQEKLSIVPTAAARAAAADAGAATAATAASSTDKLQTTADVNDALIAAELFDLVQTSESEQALLAGELTKLRGELLKLRKDYVGAQEEIQRLRGAAGGSGAGGSALQNAYAPPQLAQQSPLSVLHVVITLVVALLSMLVGKFAI